MKTFAMIALISPLFAVSRIVRWMLFRPVKLAEIRYSEAGMEMALSCLASIAAILILLMPP